MICDECGVNTATIKLMTISGGEKTERHLCTQCMRRLRGQFGVVDLSSLAGILSGLLQQAAKQLSPEEAEAAAGLSCQGCGQSYEAFRESGFLGCAQCYQAFREPLTTLLKRVQGHAQHCGRIPGRKTDDVSLRLSLSRMRQQLNRAIAQEEYEEAARLRDQIRALTAQLESRETGQSAPDTAVSPQSALQEGGDAREQ